MEKKLLSEKLEEATAEMLLSMKENSLEKSEMFEWYGYIRGTRDAAFSAGAFTEKMQQDLEEALKLIQKLI